MNNTNESSGTQAAPIYKKWRVERVDLRLGEMHLMSEWHVTNGTVYAVIREGEAQAQAFADRCNLADEAEKLKEAERKLTEAETVLERLTLELVGACVADERILMDAIKRLRTRPVIDDQVWEDVEAAQLIINYQRQNCDPLSSKDIACFTRLVTRVKSAITEAQALKQRISTALKRLELETNNPVTTPAVFGTFIRDMRKILSSKPVDFISTSKDDPIENVIMFPGIDDEPEGETPDVMVPAEIFSAVVSGESDESPDKDDNSSDKGSSPIDMEQQLIEARKQRDEAEKLMANYITRSVDEFRNMRKERDEALAKLAEHMQTTSSTKGGDANGGQSTRTVQDRQIVDTPLSTDSTSVGEGVKFDRVGRALCYFLQSLTEKETEESPPLHLRAKQALAILNGKESKVKL